jgi:hypothetical protein
MYGSAVMHRAISEYMEIKRGSSILSSVAELRTCGLLESHRVVKYSAELAFLDNICLV